MSTARRKQRTKGTRPGRPPGPASESTTRRDLLLAAREVFLEAGYEGATLQEVADRCGVNRSVVYHHFATRGDIYDAVVTDAYSILQRAMARAEVQPTLVEQLAAYIRAVQREDFRDRHLFRFLVASVVQIARCPDAGDRTRPNEASRVFFEKLVADAVRRGELDPSTDVSATAATIAAVLFGVAIHSGYVRGASAMRPIREQLIQVIAGGLPFVPSTVTRAGEPAL